MRRTPVCLLIGVIALIGCNTPPKEFAVSDVPVYTADNPDQLFMGDETITLGLPDVDKPYVLGSTTNGKLTWSLPAYIPKEFFESPDNSMVSSMTSGLSIALGVFFPNISVYDILNKQEYGLLYANKNGSFLSENKKYTLVCGWNLIPLTSENNRLLAISELRRSSQYKWVCNTDTSAQYYMEAAKNRFNEERFKPDPTPRNSSQEKDWWED
jgi:hypothetical protein